MPNLPDERSPDLTPAVHAIHPGPWGPIQLAATADGIVGLALFSLPDLFQADLARRARLSFVERLGAASGHLVDAGRQLDEYFDGRRQAFDLAVDLHARPAWDRAVLGAVRAIPFGETLGYGDVARRIGRAGAARAVGGAVGRNPIGIFIPCHRVVAGDGSLGGYGGDRYGSRAERLSIKRALLELEGVSIGPAGPAPP